MLKRRKPFQHGRNSPNGIILHLAPPVRIRFSGGVNGVVTPYHNGNNMKAFKNAFSKVHLRRGKGSKGDSKDGNKMPHPPDHPSSVDVTPKLKNQHDSVLMNDTENSAMDTDGAERADGGVTQKRMVIYNNPEEVGWNH